MNNNINAESFVKEFLETENIGEWLYNIFKKSSQLTLFGTYLDDDKDMFKEVKTPSYKSSSSEELDLEMFSRFSPEYLRSDADYLNTLADLKVALKDAENRTKSILSKLS